MCVFASLYLIDRKFTMNSLKIRRTFVFIVHTSRINNTLVDVVGTISRYVLYQQRIGKHNIS